VSNFVKAKSACLGRVVLVGDAYGSIEGVLAGFPVAAIAKVAFDSGADTSSSVANEVYSLVVAISFPVVVSVVRLYILSFFRAQSIYLLSVAVFVLSLLSGLGRSVVKMPDGVSFA
jgi:hypothetical protein